MLGINRLFVADEEQGGFDGFLLAPVDRTALFVAKALALLAFLVVVELVAVPAFAILLLGPSPGRSQPGADLRAALADVGIAVIGTLVGGAGDPDPRARPDRARCSRCRCSCRWSSRAAQATAPLLARGRRRAARRALAGDPRPL